jgi:DNA-binding MarR family transcriptional regulator
LLAALEEWGPVGQADLGRSTGVDRSDVANALAELERRGLVERTVNPDNRRRATSWRSPGRERAVAGLDRVLDEIQERVLAPLAPAERRQLTTLLRKLVDAGEDRGERSPARNAMSESRRTRGAATGRLRHG